MKAGIERGVNAEGLLPGPLRVPRRAAALRRQLVTSDNTSTDPMQVVDWINMFALAVNEKRRRRPCLLPHQPTVPAGSSRQCCRITINSSVR